MFQGPAGTKGEKGERVSHFTVSCCLSKSNFTTPFYSGNPVICWTKTHFCFTPLFWTYYITLQNTVTVTICLLHKHSLYSCPAPSASFRASHIKSMFIVQICGRPDCLLLLTWQRGHHCWGLEGHITCKLEANLSFLFLLHNVNC